MASSPESSPPADGEAPPPSPSPPSPSSSSPPPQSPPPAPQSPPPQQSPPPSSPPPPSAPPPKSSSSPSPPSPSPPPPPPAPEATGASSTPALSPPPATATPTPTTATPTPTTKSPSPPPPPRRSGGGSGAASGKTPSRGGGNGGGGDDALPSWFPIVGGVILGVAMFAVLMCVVACVCCTKKKKKKQAMNHMAYYTDQKGNVYYANAGPGGGGLPKWQQQQLLQQQHSNIPMDGLPPPPGWHPGHPSPPPPGAAPLTGDMSSSSGPYSGPHGPALPPPSPNVALGFSKSSFTYDELAAATAGFAAANLLGQGCFGYVYKGVLPNGKDVAVKQLKSGSGQGEREFQAEVEIISRVHHRHLVSLVGYCIAGNQRMLVYEFVPNKTLEHHLYGKGVPVMDWSSRLNIALGSAKGLAYLHEDCHPRIIHRDIKAANILLDNKFEAMVADFGLAKLTTDTHTHVSTRVMGTFGYLAPEYASSGKLTEKSDVFSFGVMLLELITGRRPVDTTNYMEDSLVDWARPLLARALSDEASYDELVDPCLENNFNPLELERMAACAAACVRHSARRRPKMSQIVRALEGDVSLEDLNEGVKPGQSMFFSSGGSDYDSSTYASNIQRFRKMALESSEFSNEYSGGQTSEYGLNPSESSASSGDVSRNYNKH